MTEIREKTAFEAWRKALKFIMEKGEDYKDKNRRKGKEYLNLILTVESSKDVSKPIEVLNSFENWVYPPLEEIKSFILGKKEIPGYYYHYGERAFNPNWRDQIDSYVIPLLKKNPDTKRAVVIFYNPEKDSFIEKKETPGMIMICFNLRNNKLHATAVIRSNAMFFGWPGNIYQIHVLQDYICKQVGCKPGRLATISVSAHFYDDHYEDIEKVINMRRK